MDGEGYKPRPVGGGGGGVQWCFGATLVCTLGLEGPRLGKWKQIATKRIYIGSNFCLRVVLKRKTSSSEFFFLRKSFCLPIDDKTAGLHGLQTGMGRRCFVFPMKSKERPRNGKNKA